MAAPVPADASAADMRTGGQSVVRDTGMVTLKQGQSVTWKVRLELFTPKT
jgi:hypothetical protein